MTLKVYHFYRTDRIGWDEFSAHVVLAETEAEARLILDNSLGENNWWGDGMPEAKDVRIDEVGADHGPGILLSAFHAG